MDHLAAVESPIEHADAAAFAERVRRHAGWVHATARRRVGGDAHAAEDVTQATFILLHRKRPRLDTEAALVAWLHRAVGFVAAEHVRGERRRRRRETEALTMREQSIAGNGDDRDAAWREFSPIVDALIERLGRRDREAVLLRFARQMSFTEVASVTGTTTEAARKRVGRAVDALRRMAARRGLVAGSSAALAVMLETNLAAGAAPAGLTAAATGAALAHNTSAVSATVEPLINGAANMMTIAIWKTVAGVAAGGVFLTAAAAAAAIAIVADGAPAPSASGIIHAAPAVTAPFVVADENGEYPKLSPYPAIRWAEGDVPEVRLTVAEDGPWVVLLAIDEEPATEIVAYSKEQYGDKWRKRFEEDLVQLMIEMKQPPRVMVTLRVRDLEPGAAEREIKDVLMTRENRQAIWNANYAAEGNRPPQGGGGL